jgi:hypothetical protein
LALRSTQDRIEDYNTQMCPASFLAPYDITIKIQEGFKLELIYTRVFPLVSLSSCLKRFLKERNPARVYIGGI